MNNNKKELNDVQLNKTNGGIKVFDLDLTKKMLDKIKEMFINKHKKINKYHKY